MNTNIVGCLSVGSAHNWRMPQKILRRTTRPDQLDERSPTPSELESARRSQCWPQPKSRRHNAVKLTPCRQITYELPDRHTPRPAPTEHQSPTLLKSSMMSTADAVPSEGLWENRGENGRHGSHGGRFSWSPQPRPGLNRHGRWSSS
jgi:hypothetical protein